MNQSMNQKRVKENTNLWIHTDSEFKGLPVMADRGSLISEYLDRAYNTIQKALDHYPRVFAIRFDLRYPTDITLPGEQLTNQAIERFVASLKAKIKHNRTTALKLNERIHDTVVRYIWVREYSNNGKPHYHFLLLLNRDAFHTLGNFNSGNENMFRRIVSAWASALHLTYEQAKGLIHVPDNPVYHVTRNNEDSSFSDLFYRVSYFCKVATKRYSDGEHSFGCSQG